MNDINPMLAKPGPKAQQAMLANALIAAPGYERLVAVMKAAHDQAAHGKGKERHANDLPFHEQRMQSISHMVGSPDGMAYQVAKKMVEGLAMPEHHRKVAELYGAINYLAGIVIFLEDLQGQPGPAPTPRKATKGWCPEDKYGDHNWALIDPTAPGLGNYCTNCDFRVDPKPSVAAGDLCSTCLNDGVVPMNGGQPYAACPDCRGGK